MLVGAGGLLVRGVQHQARWHTRPVVACLSHVCRTAGTNSTCSTHRGDGPPQSGGDRRKGRQRALELKKLLKAGKHTQAADYLQRLARRGHANAHHCAILLGSCDRAAVLGMRRLLAPPKRQPTPPPAVDLPLLRALHQASSLGHQCPPPPSSFLAPFLIMMFYLRTVLYTHTSRVCGQHSHG